MIKRITSTITNNIINVPGWHTKRKLIVIESDDWGSIRMPSKEVYNQFIKKGIRVDKDPACRYDSIATKQDLEALFEVLTSIKGSNGSHPVITAGTISANPDFEKIKATNYREYHYEPFTETLKRNPKYNGVMEVWRQGISAGIFHPQFHGREHLNVSKWLNNLQSDAPYVRTAFEYGTYCLSNVIDSKIKRNYLGSFDSALQIDINYYQDVLSEGLNLFEKLFGYKSISFIPTRYTYHPKIEPYLLKNSIKYLQGIILHIVPLDGGDNFKYKRRYQGTYSDSGLLYLMRNCFFEPSLDPNFDWVGDCLRRINIAFFWNKPVTICAHRLNFIGSIHENNRNLNLKLFNNLLLEIIKRYPDVEFITSDALGKIIEEDLNP